MPSLFELVIAAFLILNLLAIRKVLTTMSEVQSSLADLTAEVNEEITVMGGATAAINGLSQRIADLLLLVGDPDALVAGLNQLKTDLDTTGNELAAAVANVPPPAPAAKKK